jgi:hypothetical protein
MSNHEVEHIDKMLGETHLGDDRSAETQAFRIAPPWAEDRRRRCMKTTRPKTATNLRVSWPHLFLKEQAKACFTKKYTDALCASIERLTCSQEQAQSTPRLERMPRRRIPLWGRRTQEQPSAQKQEYSCHSSIGRRGSSNSWIQTRSSPYTKSQTSPKKQEKSGKETPLQPRKLLQPNFTRPHNTPCWSTNTTRQRRKQRTREQLR